MSSIEHQKVVLAGIIPARRDNLLIALSRLQADHFRTRSYRALFNFLSQYYDLTADVATQEVFLDKLERRGIETSQLLMFEEMFSEIASMNVPDHEFTYSIESLKDIRAQQLTGESIVEAMEILERPLEDHEDAEAGHRAARQFMYEKFGEIDQLDNTENAPEGDMRMEAATVLEEYIARKNGDVERGVLSGIGQLDDAIGGVNKGELTLIAAYTGQGKSQMSTQWMWNAAIHQGLNTFMATSETVRSTVIRRILARHSRMEQFGYPQGLNSKWIKEGTLDPEGEKVLEDVLEDLRYNANYGTLDIVQVPRGATLSYVASRMNRFQQKQEMGLCVIDYLALLRSERKRDSEREEFNEILRSSKVLATSFDQGRGVPIISPWQLKQSAYAEAVRTGTYGLASLSDTSEAEKTSDLIATLLRLEETPNEASLQILKARDAEIPEQMTLDVDYRSTYLTDRAGGGGGDFGLGEFGI